MDAIPDVARAGELSLDLERRLEAPRELVFDAWLDPGHLRRWSAPHGFDIPELSGDPRPGGTWTTTMRSPSGEIFRLRGTYREIVRPEKLVFTHAWIGEDGTAGPTTVVSVTLTEISGGTLLRFRQTGFSNEANRDGHGEGWAQCFERLAGLLAEEG